jgi:hypothetical protein
MSEKETQEKLGDKVNNLFFLRDLKEEKQDEIKKINDNIEELEKLVVSSMDDLKLEKLSTDKGSVYPKSTFWPNVSDWDAFKDWVKDKDNWHFLMRACNAKSVREQLETEGSLPPGIDGYAKRSLTYRKA